MVEATLERARRGNVGSAWPACGRIDLSPVHDAATLHGLDQAKRSTELIGSMVQIVGPDGAGLLRAILHKGLSFTDYAARCGGSGERAASRSAQQFRSLLERLAEHWPALSCE